MPDVTIKTRENGPLLVSGPITITDHLGNTYDLTGKTNVALCRCGQTKNRPFCDGSHKACGWLAAEIAPAASAAPGVTPLSLTPPSPPPAS